MKTMEMIDAAITIIATRHKTQSEVFNSCMEVITTEARSDLSVAMHLNDIESEVKRAKDAEVLIGEYDTFLGMLREIKDTLEKEDK